MTILPKILNYKNSLNVLISILESDKTLTEILTYIFKDKVQLREAAVVTCPVCGGKNYRDYNEIYEVAKLISGNNLQFLPDIRCTATKGKKCRLIKRWRKKASIKFYVELVPELPREVTRSYAGIIHKNEINGLLAVKLIKQIGKKYAFNYDAFYDAVQSGNFYFEQIENIERHPANLLRINNIFREYILRKKEDFKTIPQLILDISTSFGQIYPSEFAELFKNGYTGFLTKREIQKLKSFHNANWENCIQDDRPKFDNLLDLLCYRLNYLKYCKILEQEKKILKRNGADDLIVKELGIEIEWLKKKYVKHKD